jgi:hypothetical protein
MNYLSIDIVTRCKFLNNNFFVKTEFAAHEILQEIRVLSVYASERK